MEAFLFRGFERMIVSLGSLELGSALAAADAAASLADERVALGDIGKLIVRLQV